MRAFGVVVDTAQLDDRLRFLETVEDLAIEVISPHLLESSTSQTLVRALRPAPDLSAVPPMLPMLSGPLCPAAR